MTILDTERLVRKLSDLLHQRGDSAGAGKQAEDFALVCHAVNLRLQQCESMIKAGDRLQALQLAETTPNLLDLVTILEFREADDWRVVCKKNSLALPERIDAHAVQILNVCYAEGISTDHPLYAAYRRANLNRNDDAALKALQSIHRLNPSDTNATSELARLDAKVLDARLNGLAKFIKEGPAPVIVAELEAIEALGFLKCPEGENWQKAQLIRCQFVLNGLVRQQQNNRWNEVQSGLNFVRQLQLKNQLELPEGDVTRIKGLEIWANLEQEKDKKERSFKALLSSLSELIRRTEEKGNPRSLKLSELRKDYESLCGMWRSLENFARPIPPENALAFRKLSSALESQISRRATVRRWGLICGGSVALISGTLIFLALQGQAKTRDFNQRLNSAVLQRQTQTVEKLLEQARAREARFPSGAKAAALDSAESFLIKERSLLANFETAISKLPHQFDAEPDARRLTEIASQLARTSQALEALSREVKEQNLPRLEIFKKAWQAHLSNCSETIDGRLAQWIGSAEQSCSELGYQQPLETASNQVGSLSVWLGKINKCEASFTNNLALSPALLHRAESVREKLAAYDRELNKAVAGSALLSKAKTFPEFVEGIKLLSSSKFSANASVSAALKIQSLGASEEATLRLLLGITNEAAWTQLTKAGGSRLMPTTATPPEAELIASLMANPLVTRNPLRYRFLDQNGATMAEWIVVDELPTENGWTKVKACPVSDSTESVSFEEVQLGCFDGQYKLSVSQPVARVEKVSGLHENAAFSHAGLNLLVDKKGSYQTPLLALLDKIKSSHEGSPLFRAYLFLALSDLMKFQREAWGISFCPAYATHEQALRGLFEEGLLCGDWLVPEKVKHYEAKAEQTFASMRPISYMKQAGGLLGLTQALANPGLRYAGYVGLDGTPQFIAPTASGSVWGYTDAHKPPVYLASDRSARKLLHKAMPLSPLFALTKSGKEYLASTGVEPKDPSFSGFLPAIIQDQLPELP